MNTDIFNRDEGDERDNTNWQKAVEGGHIFTAKCYCLLF